MVPYSSLPFQPSFLLAPSKFSKLTLRVQVPNNWVLRALVIVILVQVSGKYMSIRYLDPSGYCLECMAHCYLHGRF